MWSHRRNQIPISPWCPLHNPWRRLHYWLLALAVLVSGCARPALVGAELDGTTAPEFSLTDQTGQTVSLAGLRGKAVALTFLYSTCPDVCPVMTDKLRQAHTTLGPDAARAAFVVISVDPERDTPAQLQQYTAAMRMEGRWHYLTGDRNALGRVWAAYGIGVFAGPGGMINHTDALYVLDREGRRRLLMRGDFQLDDLVANLRLLTR